MLSMHRGKGTVRFEWTDDVVESSVTLLAEDDEPTIVSKLKRIIALAEGDQPAPSALGAPGFALVQAAKAAAGYPPVAGYAPSGYPADENTNGWAALGGKPMTPPVIPEGAEYELIPPGEDA